ncbi:MAG: hypothetical protein ABSH35_04875 [Isosphaeraceae bacterium]|jgi:hypothetical protein
MDDRYFVFAAAGIILVYFLVNVIVRKFDPFAPVWLFLVGYVQVYIMQAVLYHEWALRVRGQELVAAANFRALWALVWFLTVYHLGISPRLAPVLPRPPRGWSTVLIAGVSPLLILWGLFCAGVVIRGGLQGPDSISPEEALLRSFPFVMMVAAILLIVTGRTLASPKPLFFPAGLLVAAAYVAIWMFNGKRSHSLIGVLSTVCACYITRLKRPSWPVLLGTSFAGVLVVAIAIGWRNNDSYEFSASGFTQYLSEFKIAKILESLNIEEQEDPLEAGSHETTEYGGFLLMMDTVPEKSEYDYGMNYMRVVSTYIPRILWPTKPLFGREQWVGAWIAGSELDRGEDFTGPAIGILGAAQLNGGAVATLLVMAFVALLIRTAYEYFRLHADVPWVQFWWSITFFNAWFMVVGDDPLTWFYYNWGFSGFPIVVFMWWGHKLSAPSPQGLEGVSREATLNCA